MGNVFDTMNRMIYRNPHLGRMGVDDPRRITLVYPGGRRVEATPLAVPTSGFMAFGDIVTQGPAKVITVQTSEVPVQPPRNSLIEGYVDRYFVETAELDDTELNWRLDLQVER